MPLQYQPTNPPTGMQTCTTPCTAAVAVVLAAAAPAAVCIISYVLLQPLLLLLTLHLALGVDNDTSIVLEVDEGTLLPPPGLALAHDHSGGDCSKTATRGVKDRRGGICCRQTPDRSLCSDSY